MSEANEEKEKLKQSDEQNTKILSDLALLAECKIPAKAVTNSVKPVNIGFWLLFIIMMQSGDVFKRNGYRKWHFEKVKIPIKNLMPPLYIILPKTNN